MNTIAGILVIAWIAIALVNTVSAWRYSWGLPLAEIPGTTPPAAVIVAVSSSCRTSGRASGRYNFGIAETGTASAGESSPRLTCHFSTPKASGAAP
jgi:hypothetical protein